MADPLRALTGCEGSEATRTGPNVAAASAMQWAGPAEANCEHLMVKEGAT